MILTAMYFNTDKELTVGSTTYEEIGWEVPTTDAEWIAETKKESLNIRNDEKLLEMKKNHDKKLIEVEYPKYLKATQYPDAIRWEYIERGFEEPELTEMVNNEIQSIIVDYERVSKSVELINKEIELREDNKVNRKSEIVAEIITKEK